MAKWRDPDEKDYDLPSLDEELKVVKKDKKYLVYTNNLKKILINTAIGIFILENMYLFFTRYEQKEILFQSIKKLTTSIINFF